MNMYRVKVSGCDAATSVRLALTDEELAVVRRVADAVTAQSSYACEPIMRVEPAEGVDEDDDDSPDLREP